MEEIFNMPNSNLYSLEAEEAVVGSMIINQDVIQEVEKVLSKEDFYNANLGIIFETIISLYKSKNPVGYYHSYRRTKKEKFFRNCWWTGVFN
ncbi:DnaB domain protein helicase domain protein [Caldicellulosiruptor hydrothermalis 108]|uniref:DnaB domain protein helicase domain protein n=1 Tax=Caldicellulosiruptor hydrothermalis (strain DSM 18901 / VKM B-2411 / 108) TaxID=632292 RepID=E4QE36_CALH1|nr:DnaB-like helicase N-terminal domain-containing protein [Caldicellulosiruptor hydrothermalis]ADQ06530.1 DnaB domain protein helicase domain protein [Caldicellulosiruptor hydrothermalis 108]